MVEFGDAHSEPSGAARSGSGLHVTAATGEGTLPALRVASGLAQNLGARFGLIVTEVVPLCFPLGKPAVSIDFLERRPPALVPESDIDETDIDEPDIEESDIDAEEINIEICLSRDRTRSRQEFFTKYLAFRHEILMPLLCLIYGHSRKLSAERIAMALHMLRARVYPRISPKSHLRCLLAILYLCVALFEVPAQADQTEPPNKVKSNARSDDSGGVTSASGGSANELLKRLARSVFSVELLDRQGVTVESGSGVALGADQVVTNCPALELGRTLRVRQYARSWPAVIRQADVDHDLCQLSVQGLKAPPVDVRSSATVLLGERVYALGAHTLSEGIVSGVRELDKAYVIETTATVPRSSSGGGLFDARGKLLGITTFFPDQTGTVSSVLPGEWIQALRNSGMSEESKVSSASRDFLAFQWFTLGSNAFEAGEYPTAIKYLQKATQLKPEAFGAWGIMGLCYDQLKEYDRSVKAFQQAIRLKPDSAESWDSLARVHAEMKDYEQAVRAAKEAIRLDPDDAAAWLVLGGAYGGLHNLDEAAKALVEAVRLRPDYAAAWYNLGTVYGGMKKYDRAVAAHQEAVRLEPNEPTFLYNLGHSYALQGNRSKVLEVYEELSVLNPALANQFFTANVPQSPGTATSQYSRGELRQMRREAKTPEQYQTLATYFRGQERLCREKAQSEKEEYERCVNSPCGSPKSPTRADTARQLHEYYVSEANRMAKLAEHYESQSSRSTSNAAVWPQVPPGGQPVSESSYVNLPLTGNDRMMLDRVQKLGTQTKDLLEQQGSSLAPKGPPQ